MSYIFKKEDIIVFTGNKLMSISKSKAATIFIGLMFTAHILKLTLTILTPQMNLRSLLYSFHNHKLTLAKHAWL